MYIIPGDSYGHASTYLLSVRTLAQSTPHVCSEYAFDYFVFVNIATVYLGAGTYIHFPDICASRMRKHPSTVFKFCLEPVIFSQMLLYNTVTLYKISAKHMWILTSFVMCIKNKRDMYTCREELVFYDTVRIFSQRINMLFVNHKCDIFWVTYVSNHLSKYVTFYSYANRLW